MSYSNTVPKSFSSDIIDAGRGWHSHLVIRALSSPICFLVTHQNLGSFRVVPNSYILMQSGKFSRIWLNVLQFCFQTLTAYSWLNTKIYSPTLEKIWELLENSHKIFSLRKLVSFALKYFQNFTPLHTYRKFQSLKIILPCFCLFMITSYI